MRNGIIPQIHNLKHCDFLREEGKLNFTLSEFSAEPTLRTLKNSFGFGGKCASMVIEVNKGKS
jgi:3-oxoacyl-(acyl-carrier-protein) synthase